MKHNQSKNIHCLCNWSLIDSMCADQLLLDCNGLITIICAFRCCNDTFLFHFFWLSVFISATNDNLRLLICIFHYTIAWKEHKDWFIAYEIQFQPISSSCAYVFFARITKLAKILQKYIVASTAQHTHHKDMDAKWQQIANNSKIRVAKKENQRLCVN